MRCYCAKGDTELCWKCQQEREIELNCLQEHDTIQLNDGREGVIVHVYKDNAFELELSNPSEVITIKKTDINKVIRKRD